MGDTAAHSSRDARKGKGRCVPHKNGKRAWPNLKYMLVETCPFTHQAYTALM